MLAAFIAAPFIIGQVNKQGKVFKETVEKLSPLVARAANGVAFLGCCFGFTELVIAACTILNAYTGQKAQKELTAFYKGLGKDVRDISNSLQQISEDMDVMVSHQNQHQFPQQVYDYVSKSRVPWLLLFTIADFEIGPALYQPGRFLSPRGMFSSYINRVLTVPRNARGSTSSPGTHKQPHQLHICLPLWR